MNTGYQKILETVGTLPPMPMIATRVLNQMQDPGCNAEALARTISSDAALAAQLLRMANSAFFGLPRQIRSIEQAIVLLGENSLRNMALAASLKSMNKSFGLLEKMLWEDSVGCALGARLIAARYRTGDPEEAFLAGLFRHIGKIVMNFAHPDKFQTLVQAVYNGEGELNELEGQVFSFSHAVVGAAVLKKWQLGEGLIISTLHHARADLREEHDPHLFRLAATVNSAAWLCRRLGIGQRGPDASLEPRHCPGIRNLELPDEDMEGLLEELAAAFEETRGVFLAQPAAA